MSTSPEQQHSAGEHNLENIGHSAAERSRELHKASEDRGEVENGEQQANVERKRIETLFSKERGKEKKSAQLDQQSAHQPASRRQKEASYKQTMKRIRSDMPITSRVFSKVIHNPVVEKTSEVIGSTVARPNAILAGSFCALVLVAVVYALANNSGYRLSGFETIGAFLLGWIIGIAFDFFRTMATGKRG